MLSGHEHVIDCIAWAPLDAAKTIENASYNGATGGEEAETDDKAETEGGQAEPATDTTVGSAAAATQNTEDETRTSLVARMTTKERILQMKNNLKSRREELAKKQNPD